MRIGSLVELVDDNWDFNSCTMKLHNSLPIKGKIYTIRNIYHVVGYIGVYLQEINSNINPATNIEQGFLLSRFRELQPPMSISIESILECELV